MKRIITLILLCIMTQWAWAEPYFYLSTYDMYQEGYSVHISIKKIDLACASISDSLALISEGYLATPKPIKINIKEQDCLLVVVQGGVFGKNSGPGPETTYAFIIDTGLNLMKGIKIPDSNISIAEQYDGENGFRFGSTAYRDTVALYDDGIYKIDSNYVFTKVGTYISGIGPQDIQKLDKFQYLHSLNSNHDNIYYSLSDSGYILLKLNPSNSMITSKIPTIIHHGSEIFAYHSTRNKIYVFHLNYEQHGKFEEYEKDYGEDWIVPEVLIYDPTSLNLVERHQITDFTPGNYPLSERGQADVVGDYIVYYFFDDEWMGNYNPAMLFIFDTRTNEATWLRVGWR
jgi:hypothetical protein